MKENNDILAKAVEQMKNQQTPPGPPKQVVDATVARLAEAADEPIQVNRELAGLIRRTGTTRSFLRFAAAAVLLLAVGYLIGSISAPKPTDAQELYAALKPAIQRDLLEPMNRYWLLTLASNKDELKDELHDEFRQGLNQFAVQTLAASGAATNQLLTEFIDLVKATQVRDLRSVAAALRQMELERMRDQAQLTNSLEAFAVLYDDELQRTKQDIVQLIYKEPVDPRSDAHESPKPKIERDKE